jgi:hypothetical protein
VGQIKTVYQVGDQQDDQFYCNNREERVNHYTARMYLLPAYMADWILFFK